MQELENMNLSNDTGSVTGIDGIKKSFKAWHGIVLCLADIAAVALSIFLTYYLRFYTKIFSVIPQSYTIDKSYIIYSLIFIGAAIFFYLVLRLYNFTIYNDSFYYLKIFIPPIASIIIVIVVGRLYENFAFSRIWILLLFIFSLVILFFTRFAYGRITKNLLKKKGYSNLKIIWDYDDNIEAVKLLSMKTQKILYGIFLLLADIVLLAISYFLSYYLRFKAGAVAELYERYYVEQYYVFYSVVFIILSIIVFAIYNLYDRDKIYRGSGYYSRIIKVVLINIALIMLAGYIFDVFTFSRIWLLMLAGFSLIFIIAGRYLFEFITQKIINKLGACPRTVIIGIGENARRIEHSLKKYSAEGDLIIGHVDSRQKIEENESYSRSFKIAGYLEDIKQLIITQNIHRVIIAGPEFKYFEILEILEKLKGLDVTALIFPGFFEFSMRRLSVREIGGVPLMQVSNVGFFGFNLFLKNMVDYLLGTIIFIFFIPVYLIIGMIIKLDSKGPVFYKQMRYTKDCRPFYMYKFRSMYTGAERELKELQTYNEADGPLFKIKNDPRITRVGRFLRRFSIDELPQIINVLKGELSLVGPRPPLPDEVEKYDEWEKRRMNVKQGITGLWQVSGRSDLSFEEMARLDLYYIQNWSIEVDIKILLKTIPTVLFGKGAY